MTSSEKAVAQCYVAFGKGTSGVPVGESAIEAMTDDYLEVVANAASGWSDYGEQALAYARSLGTLAAAAAIRAESGVIEAEHWRQAYVEIHAQHAIPCPFESHSS